MSAHVYPGISSLQLVLDTPYDTIRTTDIRDDLIAIKVWVSTTSGFNPANNEGTLVYDGNGLSITIPNLTAGTTYYLRYALISAIDTSTYTISSEYSGVPVTTTAKIVNLSATRQSFVVAKNTGTISPSSITLTATPLNFTSPTYVWKVGGVVQTGQTSSTFALTSFTGDAKTIRVEVTSGSDTAYDEITIYSLKEGDDSIAAGLDNENQTIGCDNSGTPYSGQLPFTARMQVVQGTTLIDGINSTVVFSKVSETGMTSSINNLSGVITVSAISANSATAVYRATYGSVTIDKTLNLNKSFDGANGTNGTNGVNGTRTAILDVYKWSATTPTTFPSGTSTYTWATGQFTAPATLNSWTLTPGAPVAGQTLWIARTVYADSGTTTTSSITWTAATALSTGAAGSNGTNGQRVGVLEVYQWSASAPTTFPSGTSTYTWTTGAFTAPSTPNGWSLLPGAAVAGQTLWGISVNVSDNLTTTTSSATWNSSTVYAVGAAGTNGTNGTNGVNGTRTAILDLYQWSATTPTTFPSGTSTYTWSTAQFTNPATLNSWTQTPGTGSAGQTLYIARQIYSDSNTTTTSTVTWNTTSAIVVGAYGANGTNGTRTAFLEIYQWAASAPTTFPSGTSTYTWSTGVFTAPTTPNSWSLTPGASTAGYTLYACSVRYSDTGTSTTSTVTWNTSTAYAVGAAGTNGATGATGSTGPQGDPGANGSNTATIYLYARNSDSANAPSFSPGTLTYTFATKLLSASVTNWYTNIASAPSGTVLWVRQVTVTSTNSTVSIAAADWSTAGSLAQDGAVPDVSNLLNVTATSYLTGTIVPQNSGSFKVGDIAWNTTTGAITGGSGIAITPKGLLAATGGTATVTIGTDGSATFAGDVNTAGKGNFSGKTNATSIAFVAGNFYDIDYSITGQGTSNATSASTIRVGMYGRSDASVSQYNIGVLGKGYGTAKGIGVLGDGTSVGGYFTSSEVGSRTLRALNLQGTGEIAIECGGKLLWNDVTYTVPPKTGTKYLRDDGTWSIISSVETLSVTTAAGDEGGEITLAKAVTNTTLATSITVDIYQNKLRFFETGGTNRGAYIDLSACAAGVGTNLVATAGGGTVTSVGLTVPTGLSISGSPITTSGTLAITLATGYSIPTTASQTNWDTAYTDRNKWDGGSTGLVAATGRTSLGATTVGSNLFTLTNPAAITFLRVNADNTVSALDAATFRTAIGAGTSSTTGTVTSVGGTGTVSGLTLTGTVTGSGNLTLGGTLSADASAISSGTIATARLGSGTASSTTALLGNNSWGTIVQEIFTSGLVTGPGLVNIVGGTGISVSSTGTLSGINGRTITISNTSSATGTVTSVGLTVPTGLSVSGSPITTSGTLAITLATGYSIPTTASQTNWDTAYTNNLRWDGGSTGLVAATGRTSLGLGSLATKSAISAADITSGIISTSNLGTGTASSSTYLRGDNTWSAISSAQTLSKAGTSSIANTSSNTWSVGPDASGNFVVYNPSGTGMFMASGATSWTANSDERLKNAISLLEDNAISRIRGLIPRYFSFKRDLDNRVHAGYFAQNVQEFIPGAVDSIPAPPNSGLDTVLTVTSDVITVHLVKAVQELIDENISIKNQLSDLLQRIQALEAK